MLTVPFSEVTFPTAACLPHGRLLFDGYSAPKLLVTPSRERLVFAAARLAGAQDNDMATPIPFAAYHANLRTALTQCLRCLAVHPCRPRDATSAGVHRNGVVADLDVLLGRNGWVLS